MHVSMTDISKIRIQIVQMKIKCMVLCFNTKGTNFKIRTSVKETKQNSDSVTHFS
jgi:hypothetical protein